MINIRPIKAFSDNYIWLIENGQAAWLVDPGEAEPVEQELLRSNLRLEGILITHHHPDHVGGINDLQRNRPSLKVIGPESDKIPHEREKATEYSNFNILGVSFNVLSIPGHTLDHIAFTATINNAPVVFCGDTLFAGGCGRIFEGSPAQMLNSLEKLAALPDITSVYCAHEYTMANLSFAKLVEPDNAQLLNRITTEQAKRDQQKPTVPTTIGLELATNPFLRSEQAGVIAAAKQRATGANDAVAVFTAIRAWKDIA